MEYVMRYFTEAIMILLMLAFLFITTNVIRTMQVSNMKYAKMMLLDEDNVG